MILGRVATPGSSYERSELLDSYSGTVEDGHHPSLLLVALAASQDGKDTLKIELTLSRQQFCRRMRRQAWIKTRWTRTLLLEGHSERFAVNALRFVGSQGVCNCGGHQ